MLARLAALGFPSLADAIRAGDVTLPDALSELADCRREHDDNPDPAVYAEARGILRAVL